MAKLFLQPLAALVALLSVFSGVGALDIPRSLWGQNILADSSACSTTFNTPRAADSEIIIESITQRVDNFDLQNNATFQQRFHAKRTDFLTNGPIYLIIIDGNLESFTYIWDRLLLAMAARSEGGLMVAVEARYYGESYPTADLSVANLRFLTVEQSLADIAHFVEHLRATTPGATATTPVIVSGAGYGGSLAVWFGQRYPHLAAGVWGHRAPLRVLRNNEQYGQNVFNALRRIASTPECFAVLEEGARGLDANAAAGKLDLLSAQLGACDGPLRADQPERVQSLFYSMSTMFSFLTAVPERLSIVCDDLVQASQVNGSTEALAKYIRRGFADDDDSPDICLDQLADQYDKMIRDERLHQFEFRRTFYQRCTQLGWFATSSNGSLFQTQVPLSLYTDYCREIFGDAVADDQIALENEDRFNTEHGGIRPHVRNALFTFDFNDPFLTLGVHTDLSATSLHYLVEDGDSVFFKIRQTDTNEMIDKKQDILAHIRSWSRTTC